jgi:hypothetical protein
MTPDHLTRALIRRRLEQPILAATRRLPSPQALQRSEACPAFERLRCARKVLGAYRYGTLAENRASGHRHRNIESAIARLQRYLADGNQEHLIDAANLCELEYERPGSHPAPHLTPVDDGPHKTIDP